ncbi:MAG: 2-oxoglutarate dehydrogenase E1 component [Bacteroidetes bacterium]|nr:2-oxoglutarate dehydrogenase E1 component [Bacteroidota bacterium]
MENYSYLDSVNLSEIENIYQIFLKNPDNVEFGWRKFFEGFEFARTDYNSNPDNLIPTEFNVINLIRAYRERGHLFTKTNPVRTRRTYSPTLDFKNFNLTEKNLTEDFFSGEEIGIGKSKLNNIIEFLQQTYCQSVGVEYMYIRTVEIVDWLKQKMESCKNTPNFEINEKKHILQKLSEAVFFEKFLHKKFPGQKSFSLDGAETLIPALDGVIEMGSELGINEFVIGMAHRGRLNVLANILHKSYKEIFSEFEGKEYEEIFFLGDVKYHLGYSSETTTKNGTKIKLNLTPNPSHLETVGPVVEGIVKAKAENDYNNNFNQIVPIIIHGDAAISGQGLIYEMVQMSQLEAFNNGGTVHFVINNQIGFTTNYLDGRSSVYCTDVAKTVQVPIFHVNGDDAEAVVYVVKLAIEFRQKFHRDVFIDLLCYRKFGHNESDEPRFTQPTLYSLIEKHPNPEYIYFQKLLSEKIVSTNEEKEFETSINEVFEQEFVESKQIKKGKITPFLENYWTDIRKAKEEDFSNSPKTGISKNLALEITNSITSIPEGINLFKKMQKIIQDRKDMVFSNDRLDWGMCEALAIGSLLMENHPVRFCGQDVERGTFSHRHAVLTIEDSNNEYTPLNNISKNQAQLSIYNSLLSEYAVLGFEYGYAMVLPETLTIWEAQFGDFANGAQIIIDQYISSAEDKWKLMNGLVVLLPHGFEGQGPEHSSARMERYLTLCADNNMQVANCSTPANFFHILRRQIHREFRKPLFVFTPKSLLRLPSCTSSLNDLIEGGFKEVIDDELENKTEVSKLVFCTGKIFYELFEERKNREDQKTAIIRIEQIYPFPVNQIEEILLKYPSADKFIWVQEEPENMGAWPFIHGVFTQKPLKVISRPPSGSPATGSSKFHVMQQKKIIEKTFEDCDCVNVCENCKMLCVTKLMDK